MVVALTNSSSGLVVVDAVLAVAAERPVAAVFAVAEGPVVAASAS